MDYSTYIEKKIVDNALMDRIARHLVIYASFIPDLSLYHGKMGIVLFFANYARYIENPLYDKFAGELLGEIYEEIHVGLPVNFESGLCGIGWGIDYLLQNGFMEGDSDEILSEIDARVMERDLRKITDYSMRTGLEGISFYIPSGLIPLYGKRVIRLLMKRIWLSGNQLLHLYPSRMKRRY